MAVWVGVCEQEGVFTSSESMASMPSVSEEGRSISWYASCMSKHRDELGMREKEWIWLLYLTSKAIKRSDVESLFHGFLKEDSPVDTEG